MWSSIQEYLQFVSRAWWALVVGAFGGVLGLLLDAIPNFSIPGWGWLIICIAAIFVAQFQAFDQVRRERDSYIPYKVRPTSPIYYLFRYLDHDSVFDDNGDATNLIMEVVQAAANGDLIVWGRQPVGITLHTSPLEPIDKSYWKHNTFQPTSVLFEPGKTTKSTTCALDTPTGAVQIFEDLLYNHDQAERIWKRKNIFRRVLDRVRGSSGAGI